MPIVCFAGLPADASVCCRCLQPVTLTLYGGPRTRASMPRWYLEEKGIPYNLVELDLRGNQHRQPDYLAINPFGKLPSLVDDSLTGADGQPLKLFESGAILLHLAECHAGEIQTSATPLWRLTCLFPATEHVNSRA